MRDYRSILRNTKARRAVKRTSDAVHNYKLAEELFDSGKMLESVKFYKISAESGHMSAQCMMGEYYFYQDPPKYPQALKFFRLSADQGLPNAIHNLGYMYSAGFGVPVNHKTSFKYWKLAADRGCLPSQLEVGRCYLRGAGVKKNHKRAFRYLTLSAKKGCDYAPYFLGQCYLCGLSVDVDYAEAYKYFKLAGKTDYTYEGVERDYEWAASGYVKWNDTTDSVDKEEEGNKKRTVGWVDML